jgi:hypothetical protein
MNVVLTFTAAINIYQVTPELVAEVLAGLHKKIS